MGNFSVAVEQKQGEDKPKRSLGKQIYSLEKLIEKFFSGYSVNLKRGILFYFTFVHLNLHAAHLTLRRRSGWFF